MTLTGIITKGQSGPGNNGNERVLHIPQISDTKFSPSDALDCYNQDWLFKWHMNLCGLFKTKAVLVEEQ